MIFNLHIFHTLRDALASALVAAMALVAVSCAEGESDLTPEPDAPGAAGVMRTGFTIKVSDSSNGGAASSRAPGFLGDGYDRGEGYENFIDIARNNFRFYFFDTDSRFIAAINVEAILPTESTATSKTYYVSGSTMLDVRNRPLKVVALANWPTYPDAVTLIPGVTTIADLCEGQYAYTPEESLPSADNPIPLFGVTNPLTLQFDDNNFAQVGTLHLLRAYAKVEVVKADDCPVDIEWARIRRYNTRGFCAPSGVAVQDDYVHNSYDKDYVNTPHIPASAISQETVPMTRRDNGSFVAYVPEFRNIGVAQAERSVIEVRFLEDTEKDFDVVEFKYYDQKPSTPPFDILRNYWYRFTLSKNLTPMVQMVPYNEVDLTPDFGILVGSNYVPVLDVDGKIIYWYDPDTGNWFGPDKVTPVTDPYVSVDPVTGWSLVRDANQRFFCYHDVKVDKFFATDKSTQIWNPFEQMVTITVNINGTPTEIDCNEIRKKVSATEPGAADKLFYYYDRNSSVWYRPDLTPLSANETPVYN